jgi:uncharacterized protein (DUF302 family)
MLKARTTASAFVSVMIFSATISCAGEMRVVSSEPKGEAEVSMDGIKTIASAFDPKQTMDRLDAAARAKGMTIFARIDHAAGAKAVGMALRPTELLIFGNARSGTPLMQAQQMMGLDLPLKALVWQDGDGKTWLSYTEPQWIVSRHGAGASLDGVVDPMASALSALAKAATAQP